jgi:hypothetical protein
VPRIDERINAISGADFGRGRDATALLMRCACAASTARARRNFDKGDIPDAIAPPPRAPTEPRWHTSTI